MCSLSALTNWSQSAPDAVVERTGIRQVEPAGLLRLALVVEGDDPGALLVVLLEGLA